MFFISAWTNVWVNKRDAVDLRRHRAHFDVSVVGISQSKVHYKISVKWVLLLNLWVTFCQTFVNTLCINKGVKCKIRRYHTQQRGWAMLSCGCLCSIVRYTSCKHREHEIPNGCVGEWTYNESDFWKKSCEPLVTPWTTVLNSLFI